MADKYTNGQVRQNLDLPPSEGDGGFVGDDVGSPLGTKVVSGKTGYVTSQPIWSQESSGDEGSDALPDMNRAGEDSHDEEATYKAPVLDSGLPQTYRTREDYDGAPNMTAPSDVTGKSTTPKVPSAASGEHELSALPQTAVTHEGGSGIPMFRNGK